MKSFLGRIKNWLYPDKIIKKCIYMSAVIAVILLSIISAVNSAWLHAMLKPSIQKELSLAVEGISAKISYILNENTKYLRSYCTDVSLIDTAIAYAEFGKNNPQNALELSSCFSTQQRGFNQPGAIQLTQSAMLVIDWKEVICDESLSPYASLIMQSSWFHQLPQILEKTFETDDHIPRDYSPVFSADNKVGTDEFITMGMLITQDNHDFLFLLIEPFADFRSLLQDFTATHTNDYCLIGRNGQILFQNSIHSAFSELSSEDIESLFLEEQYTSKITETEKITYIGTRISFRLEDLKIAAAITEQVMLMPYNTFFGLYNVLFVLFATIMLSLIFLILNRSLRNLQKLAHQMADIEQREYVISEKVSAKDEIGTLAKTYYDMIDRIKASITTIQETQKRSKQLEYSLAESQIDPHFIYNTLNTITYLAEDDRASDIVSINQNLIRILKNRLRTDPLYAFDSLSQELDQLKAYIEIQKYLCAGNLKLDFMCDPELLMISYPRNILQPLVENSIQHGILLNMDAQGHIVPGLIRLEIRQEASMIVTILSDNGIGMDSDKIYRYFERPIDSTLGRKTNDEEQNSHQHLAITNIRFRLQYLYGENFTIHAQNHTDTLGVQITLRFPKIPENRQFR